MRAHQGERTLRTASWRRVLARGQRGVASLEYVVVGLAVTALVGSLATQTEVGQTLTCQVGGTVTQAAGGGKPSCGGDNDPTAAQPIANTGAEPDDGDAPATEAGGNQAADDICDTAGLGGDLPALKLSEADRAVFGDGANPGDGARYCSSIWPESTSWNRTVLIEPGDPALVRIAVMRLSR